MKRCEMPPEQKNPGVTIKSDVLKWAIESSGWKTEDLALKLKTDKRAIGQWLAGDSAPTLKQLEDLAKYLRRPLAAFFLPSPPAESPLPPDLRTLPNRHGEFEKETLLALRRARRLQRMSRELMENLETLSEPVVAHTDLSRNPRDIGRSQRQDFRILEQTQREWGSSYVAFKELRRMIEERNVFVFQMKMPLEDARGFALVDESPPVIVVNSRDQIEARIFTLIHEYGHVLLNESGIDNPEASISNPKADRVEKWCNEFASEFLLPQEVLRKEFQRLEESVTDGKVLTRLSNRYKVSKSMLAYKMLRMDLLNHATFSSIMDNLRSKGIKNQEEGFGVPQDVRCLRERGNRFITLVYHNLEKGTIGYSDAVDLLSVRLVNVDKVLSKATK